MLPPSPNPTPTAWTTAPAEELSLEVKVSWEGGCWGGKKDTRKGQGSALSLPDFDGHQAGSVLQGPGRWPRHGSGRAVGAGRVSVPATLGHQVF